MTAFYTTSNRKRMLFLCACCRRYWNEFDEYNQKRIEAAEAYADNKKPAFDVGFVRLRGDTECFTFLSSNVEPVLACLYVFTTDRAAEREWQLKLWKHMTND